MSGQTKARAKAFLKMVADGLAAAFGFVGSDARLLGADAPDASTQLAIHRTNFAMERTYMASERTLMGWIRTALSMISFGFTLGKLNDALQSVEVKGFIGIGRMVSVSNMAYFLVVLGTFALLVATIQFRLRTNELQEMGLPRHYSIAFTIGVLLTFVGGFAFSAMVMKL